MKREENRKEKKEESKDVFYDSRDEITSQRELLENNDSELLINEENIESIQAESEPLYNERESTPLRRSTRIRKEPTRFTFNKQHGYLTVKGICMKVVKSLILAPFIQQDYRYIHALLLDSNFGLVENMMPHMHMNYPDLCKAKAMYDPDTPNIGEALTGKYSEEFRSAMMKEIEELEKHNT